ncbi:anti-anti-sigma factor [Amycolatopsis balhimycina DSM 5908]|uniref:Anti-anti-sigma factor n=1 Tax=Amycolatopsis balhimycina DSM 5908 TaxID=1081091 RepID=A0A428W3L3_AMYBA|nr:STAS domain-containing protein [Amycolatopsis balhimycina]RSM37659.1 anti-anti-sigma factor [Amycolatopsis balhimycina DSM 5908]
MSTSSGPERLRLVRTRGESGVVELVLSGELDSGTASKVVRAVAQILATEPEALILDVSDLSFLSVAGVRAIGTAHAAAGAARLRVVTGERPVVREFLHATRFDAVLDCYRTRSSAVAAGSRAEFVSHARAAWDAS